MSSPVDFKPNAIPICLPKTDDDFVGRTGTVTGWGRFSKNGGVSNFLREVQLPIISNEHCMLLHRIRGFNEWIPNTNLCAGTLRGGRNSCVGDSGGPLVVKSSNGRYILAGIVSWGVVVDESSYCGEPNSPGVYTRISKFKSWINYVIAKFT